MISYEKAVEEIKGAMPPVLLLKGGHNPLKVLHSSLSIGVHEDDDVECLQRARDIRTVLAALATKMKLAIGDSRELDTAVARLINAQNKQGA